VARTVSLVATAFGLYIVAPDCSPCSVPSRLRDVEPWWFVVLIVLVGGSMASMWWLTRLALLHGATATTHTTVAWGTAATRTGSYAAARSSRRPGHRGRRPAKVSSTPAAPAAVASAMT
jgi:hypothetical protein